MLSRINNNVVTNKQCCHHRTIPASITISTRVQRESQRGSSFRGRFEASSGRGGVWSGERSRRSPPTRSHCWPGSRLQRRLTRWRCPLSTPIHTRITWYAYTYTCHMIHRHDRIADPVVDYSVDGHGDAVLRQHLYMHVTHDTPTTCTCHMIRSHIHVSHDTPTHIRVSRYTYTCTRHMIHLHMHVSYDTHTYTRVT